MNHFSTSPRRMGAIARGSRTARPKDTTIDEPIYEAGKPVGRVKAQGATEKGKKNGK